MESFSEFEKIADIGRAAKHAVLYRKYLSDKAKIDKLHKTRLKTINVARFIVNAAHKIVNINSGLDSIKD